MAKITGTTSGRPNPHTDTGYSHATKVNRTRTSGNGNTKTTVTSGNTSSTNNQWKDDVPYKNPLPTVGPLTIIGNMAAKHAYKSRQKFATKEGLAREYYIGNRYNPDPSKRTLKPNSPEGKAFLKDAGYGKTTPTKTGGEGDIKCPDGTPPPCPTPTAAKPATPKITPYQPYYMGFDFQKPQTYKKGGILKVASKLKKASKAHASQAQTLEKKANIKKGGLSGGKRYGPPPKKGPNPHGKCPFREDGIRGVGAVQPGRGVKFVGVK